jgi:hypothetical protein
MIGDVKIEGLEKAMKAMQAAFPADPRKQQAILHRAIGSAARKQILPTSKQLALVGDASGALSEALTVRALPAKERRKRNTAASMVVTPVRSNRKALSRYISHYYTNEGLTPPASLLVRGIMHGHLVEFGSANNAPKSFLWASAQANQANYVETFSSEMRRITEQAVKKAGKNG